MQKDRSGLKAKPSCVLVLFAGLPHLDEIIVVRPAFKFVIQLVIALETFGIADSHVGVVIGYQPAFSEITMLRGHRDANLRKTG